MTINFRSLLDTAQIGLRVLEMALFKNFRWGHAPRNPERLALSALAKLFTSVKACPNFSYYL